MLTCRMIPCQMDADLLAVWMGMSILLIHAQRVAAQDGSCSNFHLPENATITEQDPKGTEVLNVSYCGVLQWSMDGCEPFFMAGYFSWTKTSDGYKLVLNKTVDLEVIKAKHNQDLQYIRLTFGNKLQGQTAKYVDVDIIPVNEFSPDFLKTPYTIDVPENTDVNTTIFSLHLMYRDRDVMDNITKIGIIPAKIPEFDGSAFFHIEGEEVIVTTKLDFETLKLESQTFFNLGLVLYDTGLKTGTTELTIRMTDVDEPPVFVRPDCHRTTSSSYPWVYPGCPAHAYSTYLQPNGEVTSTASIYAIDRDIADNAIEYSLDNETLEVFENSSCTLKINNSSGEITAECHDSNSTTDSQLFKFYQEYEDMDFNISITATEVSDNRLNTSITTILHFGIPPTVTTPSSTMTPTASSPVTMTTGNMSQTPSPGNSESEDMERLLIIIIPSAVGGVLLVIVIIVVACKLSRACGSKNESEYHFKVSEKKRQEFYVAYEESGKGEMTAVEVDTTTKQVVDVYDIISTLDKGDGASSKE
ncbi:cadherin-89D-like isoform X1 [Haliotis rufescens]|uniref:cadherin-89D-like isoform X1 n=1 Tax=Haliotis rufescens TaxID=6454 RepID=UPI00201ECCD2|nr:cadherin-89D-like isoform X1 [Haliotis rufescens]